MTLLKNEKAENSTVKLEFSVDKATFDAACEKVYRRMVKKINVPGFRAGKAPKAIIEKMYGKGVFYEGAFNAILPEAYEAAVKEAALAVVGQPEFDVVSCDENGVVFSAVVYVKPEVEIKDYLGMEVARDAKEFAEHIAETEGTFASAAGGRESEQ